MPRPDSDEVELITYLTVLWKWKWLIVGGTFVTAVAALLAGSQTPRTYRTSAKLFLTQSKIPGPDRGTLDPSLRLKTLVEIMYGGSLAAEAIQRFKLDSPPHAVTVQRFITNVISVKLKEDTSLITIAVTFPDPQLAADMANYLAQKAIELNAGFDGHGALSVREYYQRQRDRARQAVEEAQTGLLDFKRAADLEGLQIERRVLMEERVRLATRSAEISIQLAGLQTRARELSEAIKDQEPILTLRKSIVDDPSLLAALQETGATSLKAVPALQIKTEEINPTYHDIRKELVNAEASLASLGSERKEVERKLEKNKERLADIEQRIGLGEFRLTKLTQPYSQARESLEFWRRKGDEAGELLALGTPELRIVEPAAVPPGPLRSKAAQTAAFVSIVTLLGLSLLAFLLEYLKTARRPF